MRKLWVGRAGNCAVQVIHKNVSKLHGYFSYSGGQASYADAGSTNGTRINSRRLNPQNEVLVPSKAEVNFGGVKFTFYSAKDFYEGVLEKIRP